MVLKQEILDLIRQTAEANGGRPLGIRAFENSTGIAESQWLGIHAARWNDLVQEAGYLPNEFIPRTSDADLLQHLIALIRHWGHFPTQPERDMARHKLPAGPGERVLRNRGSQHHLATFVAEQLRGQPEYLDVVDICEKYLASHPQKSQVPSHGTKAAAARGYVYLIKTPRGHRIGMTTRAVGSRLAEHENQQGEAELLHRITTDDPAGVERYWHQRFADKRSGTSDHFNLTATDVNAFKRWKKIY